MVSAWAKLLRDHLGIDADPACHHLFEFGTQKHPSFSDNAVRAMKDWLAANDIEALWRDRRR